MLISAIDSTKALSTGASSINSEYLTALITAGVTIAGGIIFLIFQSGKVMQRLAHVDKDINSMNGEVADVKNKVGAIPHLETKIEKLTTRVDSLKDRIDTLWQKLFSVSQSPVQLTDHGKKVLETSGIKQLVEANYGENIWRATMNNMG